MNVILMLSGHLFVGFSDGCGHGRVSTRYLWAKVKAGLGRADMPQQDTAPLLALHFGVMQGIALECFGLFRLGEIIIEIGN
jgi:hypothetical protein